MLSLRPDKLQSNLEEPNSGFHAKKVFLDTSELEIEILPCELKFRKGFQMLKAHRSNWESGT